MKKTNRVIVFSFVFGLLVGLVDAYVDYAIYNEGTFWQLMVTAVPKNIIFMRILILICFTVFGIVISKIMVKQQQVATALVESEHKYRRLFESAGDAIFIMELEGKKVGQIIAANQAAAKMHDYTVDELLTMNIAELDAPEAAKEISNRAQRILNGEWLHEEINHQRKDGTIFPVEINCGLLEIDGHKYVLAFDRDITVRKQAEEALSKSEQRFRIALMNSKITVHNQDRDLRYTWVYNPHSKLDADSILGKTDTDLVPSEDAEILTTIKRRVLQSGIGERNTVSFTVEGKVSYYDLTVEPMLDNNGNIVGVTGAALDITEHKQAEEKIANLAKFPAENPHPVIRIDKEGTILFSNQAGTTLLEFWKCCVGQSLTGQWKDIVQETLDSGRVKEVELEYCDSIFFLTFAPVVDANYVNVYALDITERKQAEKALQKSEEILQKQKIALEHKNIALSEILRQIELEKKKIQENVMDNVDNLLLPTLQKLRTLNKPVESEYFDLLQKNLEEITSSFGSKINDKTMFLAPKEIEICNLINNNLTNKDIAEMLNISPRTVETHRFNIRKKLNIDRKDINLAVYLKSLV